jgi:stringent starvation protein B
VPKEHVRNGEIVLNVSMLATDKLQIQNEEITFQARFSGRLQQIIVPMDNVRAIYAKETGNGMAFELQQESPQPLEAAELPAQQSDLPQPPKSPKGPDGRPKLTRVK